MSDEVKRQAEEALYVFCDDKNNMRVMICAEGN